MLPTDAPAPPITHYENFPVASWLCPARLRAPIGAIYHFARTADDLADEGEASPAERLEALTAYRQALSAASGGQPVAPDQAWAWVFAPLQQVIRTHQLPTQLLHDLLDAFVQDVEKTRDGAGYADQAELLARQSTQNTTNLIAEQTAAARAGMLKGSELVHRIPGRAGWELRLVVQGGLRILDRIEALKFATLQTRPTLRRRDLALMGWRALWM